MLLTFKIILKNFEVFEGLTTRVYSYNIGETWLLSLEPEEHLATGKFFKKVGPLKEQFSF